MELEEIENRLGLKIEKLFYKFPTYYQIMPWNIWSRPAVYYFFDIEYEFLYIGQTKTLRKRIISHNTARNKSEPWMKHVEYIAYNYCDKESLREIEKKEILKYEPIFNVAICGE